MLMGFSRRKGTTSGRVMCCWIHFSCSVSLRQIQFAFRKSRGRLHPARFGRSELLLGESGEHSLMEVRWVQTCSRCWGLLFKGVWCSRRPGRLKIKVWSLASRLQRLGAKLPTLSPFTQRPSIMAKDRKPPLSRQPALQVPLRSPLSDGFFGERCTTAHES